MTEYLKITRAANLVGVCVDTLRRMEKKGLIACEWNSQGERIFSVVELERVQKERAKNGLRKERLA